MTIQNGLGRGQIIFSKSRMCQYPMMLCYILWIQKCIFDACRLSLHNSTPSHCTTSECQSLRANQISKKVPFWAKIWLFWGINRSLKLNLSFITPEGHIVAWFHVFCAIACKNPSTGLTCARYISPIFPEALSGCICTKFGIGGSLADVINCAEFLFDWFRGIDFVGVEICLFL